jgi:hypothetical protein
MVAVCSLVTTVAVLTTDLLLRVAEGRRLAREQQTARQEVANALERMSAERWEDITAERAAAIELSTAARQVVPSGALAVEVSPVPSDAGCRRVTARFTWRDRRGNPRPALQASAWVHRRESAP